MIRDFTQRERISAVQIIDSDFDNRAFISLKHSHLLVVNFSYDEDDEPRIS